MKDILAEMIFSDFWEGLPDRPVNKQFSELASHPLFINLFMFRLRPGCDRLSTGTGPFGECATNPIPVNEPLGEIIYLNRLRNANGVGFFYHRLGSLQVDSVPEPVDMYELIAVDKSERRTLFFCMYYPRRSLLAPTGLSLLPWPYNRLYQLLVQMPLFGTNKRLLNFPFDLVKLVRHDPILSLLGMNLFFAEQIHNLIYDSDVTSADQADLAN